MPSVSFRPIIPGEFRGEVCFAILRKKTEEAGKQALKECKALTNDWKKEPKWRLQMKIGHGEYGHYTFACYTNNEIVRYWNDGTKPHLIQAKYARALRWYDQGNPIFATSVNHPGTKGTHALEALSKKFLKVFAQIENEAMNEIAKRAPSRPPSGEGRIQFR